MVRSMDRLKHEWRSVCIHWCIYDGKGLQSSGFLDRSFNDNEKPRQFLLKAHCRDDRKNESTTIWESYVEAVL